MLWVTMLGHEAYKGMLTKLSRKAAEAILDHPVSNLTNVKMHLMQDGREIPGSLYAKVIDAVAATLFPYVLLQYHRRSRGSFRPRLQLLPIPRPLPSLIFSRTQNENLKIRLISALMVFDEVREPVIGHLRRALERFKINVDQAETAAVTFRPLEIIEQ
jgi:hypothetical protein